VSVDANIRRVYVTTFVLGVAYGVAISLIAIFLDARGFEKGAIGSLAAWFASGIVLFSLPAGVLIRRFGPKPTLLASLVGYAIAVGSFPFLESYAAIAAARFADGAFSVSVWVSLETILLARADAAKKARVMSGYAIALAFGYVMGPLAARAFVAVAPLDLAFWMAGGISAGAALFVLTRMSGELPVGNPREPRESAETPSLSVLWRIKTSCFATFAYGYFQASVVLFLPLYLIEEKALAKEQTIVIPAFFAAGMLLFASIAARLGDRIGHLAVMRSLAAVGTLMIFGFVWLDAYPAMCVAVFVAGATLASISPVSLALQGIVSEQRDLARATAIYNAFYAAGMLLGPPVSSILFQRISGAAMLHHLAALWIAFVAFTLAFRRDDPAVSRAIWAR
jgi:MFS family permease